MAKFIPPADGRCHAQYERPGGRQLGDRVVDCARPFGHDGYHEDEEGGAWKGFGDNAEPTTHGQHDQGERRDRQIQAARDLLVECFGEPDGPHGGPAYDQAAAELVDAVNAAGDPTACPACATDPHDEPDKAHIHATPYGYCVWAPGGLAFVDELRREAEARGYAQAVANLRDVNRFLAWWRAQNLGGAIVNGMAADYLEAVGPSDRLSATESAPDGATHTEGHDDGRTGGSGT